MISQTCGFLYSKKEIYLSDRMRIVVGNKIHI